jgi:hypothetical protein
MVLQVSFFNNFNAGWCKFGFQCYMYQFLYHLGHLEFQSSWNQFYTKSVEQIIDKNVCTVWFLSLWTLNHKV